MATLFYDHLIDWHRLEEVLRTIDLESEEREEVWEHTEHILHTEIFIVLVTHLPVAKHEEFVQLFHAAPHAETHLEFLKKHGADIEEKVRRKSSEIIDEVLKELIG